MTICNHLDRIDVKVPESVEGCEDCLRIGAKWVHLRVCRTCGHVGCCESSPNSHASAHASAEDHPVITSLEPGEEWSYCYADKVMFVLEE